MKKMKLLFWGAAFLGVLLSVFNHDAQARRVGRGYHDSVHIEATPRSATPDVTVGNDDAFIAGTLEVDGAARFDGTITAADFSQTSGEFSATKLRVGEGSNPDVSWGADDLFVEGTAEIDGAARLDGKVSVNAALAPWSRTKAQFDALTPAAAGEIYICSDCTVTYAVCVSTGTGLSDFRQTIAADTTTGCGSNE